MINFPCRQEFVESAPPNLQGSLASCSDSIKKYHRDGERCSYRYVRSFLRHLPKQKVQILIIFTPPINGSTYATPNCVAKGQGKLTAEMLSFCSTPPAFHRFA